MNEPGRWFEADFGGSVGGSRRQRVASLVLAVGLAGMASGCLGAIEGGAGSASGTPTTGPGSTGGGGQGGGMVPQPGTGGMLPPGAGLIPGRDGAPCLESAPPLSPLRRLTRNQYSNTLRDLLGEKRALGDGLPKDDQGEDLFDAASTLIVTPTWAQKSMDTAEEGARTAVANLGVLLPCKPDGDPDGCAKKFIETFGKRAYRRPLGSDEVADLLQVHAAGAGSGGFNHGIELVVRAMLQAPSFLYRLELGDKGSNAPGLVKLTPYEVAARLSYTLAGTMPDRELMEAADAGALATPEQVTAHARRLLWSEGGRASLVGFHQRWFGLDGLDEVMKDRTKYPEFDEAMIAALKGELGAVLGDLLWKGDGRLQTLLTSRVAFVNAKLAPLYGVPAPAGEALQRIELKGAERSGILTDVAVLSAHTFADSAAAIHRGKFVRERFLCTTPPNPPADLNVVPPEPPPNVSNREALSAHTKDPGCQPCHEYMDPIGFGFEGFDGVGRVRATDGGRPVDDRGEILQSKDVDGTFKGVAALAAKLAGSAQVRDCVMSTIIGFAQGPEVATDACVQQKLRAAFAASNHDLRELVVNVAGTDGFQYRRTLSGEVRP